MTKKYWLNIGDKVTRVMPPSRFERAWLNDGEVVDVKEGIAICEIMVDIPRTILVDRNTGRNINVSFDNFVIKQNDR